MKWHRSPGNGRAIRVVLVCLALVAVSVGLAQLRTAAQSTQAPLIPNASRIRGRVVKYSIWEARLAGVQGQQVLYSVVLDVCASENVGEETSLVKIGDRIEAFSRQPLSADLLGKTIQCVVRARGDERGQRYWLREVRQVPPEEACPDEKKPRGSGRQK